MGTKKWPRVSRSSWLAFLKIWIVEHATLGDEWIKFQTLKGLLDDPEDIESAKHMKTSEELINSLKVKYGGLIELTPGEIAKLKDLKRPANNDIRNIVSNCLKFASIIKFVEEANQLERLEANVIREATFNCFSAENYHDFARKLHNLKTNLKDEIIDSGVATEESYQNNQRKNRNDQEISNRKH